MSLTAETGLNVERIGELVGSAMQAPEGLLVLSGLYAATIRQFPTINGGLSAEKADVTFRALEEVFPEAHLLKVTQAEGQHLEVSTLPPDTSPSSFARERGREIDEDDAWYYTPGQVTTFGGWEPIPVFSDGIGFPWDCVPKFDEDGVASFVLEIVAKKSQSNPL